MPKRLPTLKKPARPSSPIHTSLTILDIDAIHACDCRVKNAVALLELGLLHQDDDEISEAAQGLLPDALLDVVARLRQDITAIRAVIDSGRTGGAR